MAPAPSDDILAAKRRLMVENQLRRRGVTDPRVLAAMERIPRHVFVDTALHPQAYEDHPLPIGSDQTISQPYMVALMTELCELKPGDRVLEIGAGSGYQTAILASLSQHVYATEYREELVSKARQALSEVGCDNVTLEHRDGSLGWPEHSPFDVVLVAAGAPSVPAPLQDQLADGGRMVIPVGGKGLQILQRVVRNGDHLSVTRDTACRFVDLRGEHGWDGKGGLLS